MACLFGSRDQSGLMAHRIEQNGICRAQLSKQRVPLSNDPRSRVADNGKTLGRRLINKAHSSSPATRACDSAYFSCSKAQAR
jgi:hypothetical protein